MNEQARQYVEDFMARLIARNPGEAEFHQAVREVAESLAPHIVASPVLQKMKVLERIAEPERVIIFRVPWLNDKGEIEINRGYRVQMNSAIGPYKGGIRFHHHLAAFGVQELGNLGQRLVRRVGRGAVARQLVVLADQGNMAECGTHTEKLHHIKMPGCSMIAPSCCSRCW